MDALHKLAFYQGRRDEVPNQALAASLARAAEMTKSQLARLRKVTKRLEAP